MKIPTAKALIASSQLSSVHDTIINSWSNTIGISATKLDVITSPLSVAGRGVFATESLSKGETAMTIPRHCIFAPQTASILFPGVSSEMEPYFSNIKNHRGGGEHSRNEGWFNRLLRRAKPKLDEIDAEYDDDDDDDVTGNYIAELTVYALATMQFDDHPWTPWISQWHRDDPFHQLFASGAKSTDVNMISATAKELHGLLPDISPCEFEAAIILRLRRFEKHKELYKQLISDNDDNDYYKRTADMYSTLSSRVIDLGGGSHGVIPYFDMINHSFDPNLILDWEGSAMKLYALRDIKAGEEVFISYTDIDKDSHEYDRLWTLVQWGIPVPKAVI